jgi:hypothetical protein
LLVGDAFSVNIRTTQLPIGTGIFKLYFTGITLDWLNFRTRDRAQVIPATELARLRAEASLLERGGVGRIITDHCFAIFTHISRANITEGAVHEWDLGTGRWT